MKFPNRSFLVALFILIQQFSFAQDKIIKLNRDTINCKVVEVGPHFIRYDTVIKNEIVLKSIDMRDVFRVNYSNGHVDSISGKRFIATKFPTDSSSQKSNDDEINSNVKRIKEIKVSELCLYFIFTDKFAHMIAGGIMYTFLSGYISIEAPVSVGMVTLGILDTVTNPNPNEISSNERMGYFNPYKIFSSGLGINYYPTPHLKSQFFVGISIAGGQFKYRDAYYDYVISDYVSKELTGSYGSLIPKIGAKFLLTKHLQLSMNFGVGITQSKKSYYQGVSDKMYNEYINKPGVEAGIHIGYRF